MEQEFLEDVVARLEGTSVTYAITGSIASSFWGIPRTTHDIDLVVVLSEGDADRIVKAFADPYYVSAEAVRDAVQSKSMFNVIDPRSGLKADLWIKGDEPFNQIMLSRRKRVEIVPGCQAYVATAEDVLLHKLVWNEITPSERQLQDAAGIASVQADNLDRAYLRDSALRQNTSEVLEEVLQGKHLKST